MHANERGRERGFLFFFWLGGDKSAARLGAAAAAAAAATDVRQNKRNRVFIV